MNNLRQAAQQALEALEQSETTVPYEGFGMAHREAERKHQAAITALRAALAEPQDPVTYNGWVLREVLFDNGEPVGHREPQQEPVAWMYRTCGESRFAEKLNSPGMHRTESVPLYAAPQPAKREPLTDEEIDRVTDQQWASNNHKPIYAAHRAYARAIERAHGIGGGT